MPRNRCPQTPHFMAQEKATITITTSTTPMCASGYQDNRTEDDLPEAQDEKGNPNPDYLEESYLWLKKFHPDLLKP